MPPPPAHRHPPPPGGCGCLVVQAGARAAARAWRDRAVEADAADALVRAVGTAGLSPEAAVSVARLLTGLTGASAALRDGLERHAAACAGAVADLEATDLDVAALLDPVLPTAGAW